MGKLYIRDGRAPVPEDEMVSRRMSAIKAKDTKPELLLRKALWNNGTRGYRIQWGKAPGKPDIAFPCKKIAIFVNGCYWHRCPKCRLDLPRKNTSFWKEKFEKNVTRDKRKIKELEDLGWRTLTIWECEIMNQLDRCLNRVTNKLYDQ
ncbi:very short patch repair endonuclease [Robiginitalea sp. SC105]|uniref:very short patch repair endonuclease n=1 Tax=Robiginitalea sp. SC105 TaxID=2762332 RepID=UPI001639C97D|nr:very short patch repair endonuclease [Robiginitalea sp. SC105]MBC2840101.1 very short patch repair endonuclease [Robiginitalea sp. SC105]